MYGSLPMRKKTGKPVLRLVERPKPEPAKEEIAS